MLLTETISFDSLKNYEGLAELSIKEKGAMEVQPRPCDSYLHTADCREQYTFSPDTSAMAE